MSSGSTPVPGRIATSCCAFRSARRPDDSGADAWCPDDDGTEGTFRLTVLPPDLGLPGRPRDVVLVLDRSGSMSGWKMVAARRAAARIVDTLTEHDRFAVLAFDHSVETPATLPAGLVPGPDRNRFRSVEFLAALSAPWPHGAVRAAGPGPGLARGG